MTSVDVLNYTLAFAVLVIIGFIAVIGVYIVRLLQGIQSTLNEARLIPRKLQHFREDMSSVISQAIGNIIAQLFGRKGVRRYAART